MNVILHIPFSEMFELTEQKFQKLFLKDTIMQHLNLSGCTLTELN